MSGNIKHIIALVVVLVIAAGAYYVIQDGTLLKGRYRRADEVQRETEQLKKEIIAPLARLQSVTIDQTFFEGQEYKALEDKSVTLTPPELERPNPFGPVK